MVTMKCPTMYWDGEEWTITTGSTSGDESPEESEMGAVDSVCDVNTFDETNNTKLDGFRDAKYDIAKRLEQINDKIFQHRLSITTLEQQRDYLRAQANEDLPIPADQR